MSEEKKIWWIQVRDDDPEKGWLFWRCKRHGQCSVPIHKSLVQPRRGIWRWENENNVRPSINCDPAGGGCGIHFTLVDGKAVGHPNGPEL
jgi:hypothetical protein